MKITSYAAFEKGGSLKLFEYDPKPLAPDQIEVKISHCGICHSDIHLLDNDLGFTKYPLVPGHEIIGEITALGDGVKWLQLGQRVGFGWQSGSCRNCELCLIGEENLCSAMESTCVTQYGGYARSFRGNAHFAVPIPEGLSSECAAPLMCGGVTVYQPLRFYNVLPQMRVGVIGIGGLGHIALQFARAFGCEVTAFSSSAQKAKEALSLGVHNFVDTSDPESVKKFKSSQDFIFSTVSVDLNWDDYFAALKPKGNLCLIGLASKTVTVEAAPLVFGQRTVSGSWIGSPAMIREMLDFSARHKIKVMAESYPMADVNKAIDHVRQNKVRYRAVLAN